MSRIQTTTQYEYANSETTYPHLDLIEGLNRRVRYTYKDGSRDNIPVNNQEKIIEITQNGSIEILPDLDHTGLSKVIAHIDVVGGDCEECEECEECKECEECGECPDLEILTLGEYRLKIDNGEIINNMWYCIMSEEDPYELYFGQELVAKRGELESPGFPYTFPLTF